MSQQTSSLSQQESQRYLRQIQLPSFGVESQLRLKKSRVLVVGIGGLGCPAAQYLAAAGIGELILVDDDVVQLSNLQRQILFSEADINKNKAHAAAARLAACNSDINIQAIDEALSVDNALGLIENSDLILDCTDNFETRYLINDMCAHLNKPWIYASVLGFDGQLALIKPSQSCFRCLYPVLADTADCNQAGVLGVVPGLVASLQALQAINHLTQLEVEVEVEQNHSEPNQLHVIQGSNTRTVRLKKSPACELCNGKKHDLKFIRQLSHSPKIITIALPVINQISWQELQNINDKNIIMIDVREKHEHQTFNLGGLNIPLENLRAKLIPQAGKTYIFYCQSGSRSQRAVESLLNQVENAKDKPLILKSLTGGVLAKPYNEVELQ